MFVKNCQHLEYQEPRLLEDENSISS